MKRWLSLEGEMARAHRMRAAEMPCFETPVWIPKRDTFNIQQNRRIWKLKISQMFWEGENPGAEWEDLDLSLQLYKKKTSKRMKARAVGFKLQNLIQLTIYFIKHLL